MRFTNANELSGGMKVLAAIAYILMILIGFYMFLIRDIRMLINLFSAAVLMFGVHLITRYAYMKDERSGWDLLNGLINIIFGLVMLFGSTETRVIGVIMIEIFIGVWALFSGFSHIFGSFKAKKEGSGSGWGWKLAGGILILVCGIGMLAMPLITAWTMVVMGTVFIGIALVFTGFGGLASALSGKKVETVNYTPPQDPPPAV